MQAAPAFPETWSLWRWLARYLTSMTKLDQAGSHRPAGDGRDAISRRLVAGNAVLLAGLGMLDPQVLLVMASMLWSGAFALLLVLLVRLRDLRPAGAHAGAAEHGG